MDIAITKGEHGYLIQYIHQRIRNNKNFLAAITGQTGSGKSYSAMRLGELLDKNFDVRNICFTPQEFMDLVNQKTKSLKRGAVIVYDEIQVSMSHLEYHSLQARILNYIFQTFRHRNFILFMTSPHFSFINASLRKLFHARLETISIDKSRKSCTLKPMLMQVNQRSGVVYEKYLRVYKKESGLIPLKRIRVTLPSKELLEEYEKKKDEFTSDLNESISKELGSIKTEKATYPLTDLQKETLNYLIQKLDPKQIAEKMNVSIYSIEKQMTAIRKKGVLLNTVYNDNNTVAYYNVDLNGKEL